MDWLTRWQQLWLAGVGTLPHKRWLEELQANYTTPDRAYHTLHHLAECLHHFDTVRTHLVNPVAVELALWCHDVIYDPRRSDNEEASARWAQQLLQETGAPSLLIQSVAAFIHLTKHAVAPTDGDSACLLDIDLAILGAPPTRFAEYERQVRQEYAWVAWPAFCTGRAQILRAFLQRPAIYQTPLFHARFEAQARHNLAAALQQLTAA